MGMIDFGLSKRYVSAATGNHVPMRLRQYSVGTPRFVSDTVESGWEPCRRDDLISVGYIALLLVVGKLPWQGMKGKRVGQCKRATKHKKLCKGLPDNFVKYFDYSSGLAYDDTPDYNYLKQLVRNSCIHQATQEDVVVDPAQGRSVLQRSKPKHTKRRAAAKKPSLAKHFDTPSMFSLKAAWDQISSVALKKVMFIKEKAWSKAVGS